MSIKYVEDYRINNTTNTVLSDTDTIQAAIDDLTDGDTLVFNKKITENGVATAPGTYVLDDTICFTSYKKNDDGTASSITRSHITFEGLGCTVENGSTFNSSATENKVYFTLSDVLGNGLINCTINGFKFVAKGSDYRAKYTAMAPCGDVHGSNYIKECVISNCEFKTMGRGLYWCGERNTIMNCYFVWCSVGIEGDCPNHGKIHSNRFHDSDVAIHMTKPFWSEVCDNFFYRTHYDSISVDGTLDREVEEDDEMEEIYLSICSNLIFGAPIGNQRGIYISGVKDLMVKDNFIRGITYLTEEGKRAAHTDKDGVFNEESYNNDTRPTYDLTNYGIGIYVDGLVNYNIDDGNGGTYDNIRYSKRCIISGNQIQNCKSCGIKTNLTSECLISNNTIYRDVTNVYPSTSSSPIDYGIYTTSYTGRHKICSNVLYNYDNGNTVYLTDIKSIKSFDNTVFGETLKTVSATISEENSQVLIIEDYITLEDKESFFLTVPEDYYSNVAFSIISYNGKSSIVYKESDGSTVDLSDYAGQTVRLKHTVKRLSTQNQDIGFEITIPA